MVLSLSTRQDRKTLLFHTFILIYIGKVMQLQEWAVHDRNYNIAYSYCTDSTFAILFQTKHIFEYNTSCI